MLRSGNSASRDSKVSDTVNKTGPRQVAQEDEEEEEDAGGAVEHVEHLGLDSDSVHLVWYGG